MGLANNTGQFAAFKEMTPNAEIILKRYTKSIIKSYAALSYDEAHARMDDRHMIDPLTTDLRNLNSMAKILRQRRIERGALTLDFTNVKANIDIATHGHVDIKGMDQIWEACQMIEELMLASNFSIAEKIYKHFPWSCLLRRQPPPSKELLESLQRMTSYVGYDLDISSSKVLVDSLDHVVGDDQYYNKLIMFLANKCMTKATYLWSEDLSFAEFHHYGLAATLYIFFTSPIRRYADVIVYGLLAAALEIATLPPIFLDGLQLTNIVHNQRTQKPES